MRALQSDLYGELVIYDGTTAASAELFDKKHPTTQFLQNEYWENMEDPIQKKVIKYLSNLVYMIKT